MTTLLISTFIAIALSGWMVGNEMAVGTFVHPKLWTLADPVHLRAVQPIARIYGTVMPFWYGATLLASLLLTYQLYSLSADTPFRLALTASVLWFLSIVYTLWGLAPINSRIAKWDLNDPPADWKEQRQRWDTRHRWRVAGLVIAFTLLTLAGLLGLMNHSL